MKLNRNRPMNLRALSVTLCTLFSANVFASAVVVSSVALLSDEVAEAQGKKRKSSKSGKRAKISGSKQGQSKKVKYKKDTKVDFGDELIEGGVKNPFQSMIGGRDGDNKQGFIKIRKEWHDQMIMSVNGLSQ